MTDGAEGQETGAENGAEAQGDAQGSDTGAENQSGTETRASVTNTDAEGTEGAETSDFQLPDEHKEKPWASKIKSQEDLYKQLDGLNTAVGKKHLMPDFKTALPEEIESYHKSIRPESVDAYDFGETGSMEGVGDLLFEANISEHQAKTLIPAYQAMEKAAIEQATSAEGFEKVMTETFGEGYDKIVVGAQSQFKVHLSEANRDIVDKMSNAQVAAVHQLAHNMLKSHKKSLEEHGVTENADAHLTGGGGLPSQNIDKQITDKRAEINKLSQSHHTAAQLDTLNNDLYTLTAQRTKLNQKRK